MEEDLEGKARELIEEDLYAAHLGAKLLDIRPGWAKVGLKLSEDHINFLGMVHGGVIFSLADVAFGAAANSFGTRAMALTVGIDFLAAAELDDELTAEVELMTRAGKMGYYRMVVMDSSDNIIARCHGWAYHTNKPLREDG